MKVEKSKHVIAVLNNQWRLAITDRTNKFIVQLQLSNGEQDEECFVNVSKTELKEIWNVIGEQIKSMP